MRRLIVVGATLAAAAAAAYGASAAGLAPFTSARVAGGSAAITACDGDGFTVSYTTSGGNVTVATVSGIADPDCEGGSLSIVLTNTAGSSIAAGGPLAVPSDGDTSPNSLAVFLSANPAAEQVAGYQIAVAGP